MAARRMTAQLTTGCLLVVLLDNGPTAPWIRPDLPGRPRRVGGGCATTRDSPDKAEVSGSSPLRPTLIPPCQRHFRCDSVRCIDRLQGDFDR